MKPSINIVNLYPDAMRTKGLILYNTGKYAIGQVDDVLKAMTKILDPIEILVIPEDMFSHMDVIND